MDDLIEKKEKLKRLQMIIPKMKDNILKVNTVSGYIDLLGYIKDAHNLSQKECAEYDLEIEDITKADRYTAKKTNQKLDEFCHVSHYLYEQFKILIEEYRKNDFCSFFIW